MNDIRVLFPVIVLITLGLGLLLAKAFAFSIAWVLWPVGALAVVLLITGVALASWVP